MPITTKAYENLRGLPKKVDSLCPECGKMITAEYYEENGKVMSKKTCPEHGEYKDVIWSDAELYLRCEEFAADGIGLKNKMDTTTEPKDNVELDISGKVINLRSCTALANLDLTNRCNMHCPICFAEANSSGYVYEPSYEQVVNMMKMLRAEEPIKCTAIQFSGGEPTVHPRFIEIIKAAKELKFAQVQVATNGIEFAKSFEFCQKAKDAGLNTVYLSFDGVSDDIYVKARNRRMLQVKEKVIKNFRKMEHHPSIVLVPTVVKGMNDKQIGDILRFALDNSDVVRGVNFQPVAFTGRISKKEVEKGRYTITDLVRDMEEQTGWTKSSDWFPVPCVAPVSKFASVMLGKNKVTFTAHPHCGLATYLFIDKKGIVTPLPRFVDAQRFFKGLDELADKAAKSSFKYRYLLKAKSLLMDCLDESQMPEGMTKKSLTKALLSIMSNKSKKKLAEFSWGMMYVGGMHFQDSYNYDVSRVERCAIHYATPDLRVIPFCAYNSGPEYRVEVEKKYSMPIAEWKALHAKEAEDLAKALIVPKSQRPDGPEPYACYVPKRLGKKATAKSEAKKKASSKKTATKKKAKVEEEKPVKKSTAKKTSAKKKAEAEEKPATKKKSTVKKAPAKKETAKKPAATKTTKKAAEKAPAKKSTSKKAPVKKETAKKPAATKTTKKAPAKKAVAKKAPAKKPAAKKSTAKKVPAKKTAAKKPATKKKAKK